MPCCARRLSRRAFDVFRLGTAIAGRDSTVEPQPPRGDATGTGVRGANRARTPVRVPVSMPGSDTFLVTGLLGCIGTWVAAELVRDGATVVGLVRSGDTHRLDLVLDEDERSRIRLVRGDITDRDAIGAALDEHAITHVVHLAALQIPACKTDPAACVRVNVLGTLNVFEAVRARRPQIAGVTYASSNAVYGPQDTGAEDER